MRRHEEAVWRGIRGLMGMSMALMIGVPARGEVLSVGSEVVLSGPDLVLRAEGSDREIWPGEGTRLKVERVAGGRLLVALPDGRHRGWIGDDRVVPRDRAMGHFDAAIERDPKDADAYRMRGRLWADRGEFDRALADFDRAIELAPDRPGGYLDRGRLLLTDNDRPDRAVADFNEAIQLDPRSARAYAGRAKAWLLKHNYGLAIEDDSSAIALEPEEPDYFIARGWAWSRRGDHDRTIADFSEAIRLSPDRADAYIGRGREWEKDVKPVRALADYRAAIARDPRAIAAYEGRGRIWKKRGEFGRVLSNYEELARKAPDDPAGHREVAWFLATCDVDGFRDGRRALGEATAACKLTKWSDPGCLEVMAAAFAEVGDFDTAIRWQTRAMAIFNSGLDRYDRRLRENRGRDARMSNGLYRYRKRLPYRERPDRSAR